MKVESIYSQRATTEIGHIHIQLSSKYRMKIIKQEKEETKETYIYMGITLKGGSMIVVGVR